MLQNSIVKHRAKHFDLLLARQLALIERDYSRSMLIHQKLEDSLRRANHQTTNLKRKKSLISFENVFSGQNKFIDARNANQKYRLSIGTTTNSSNSQSQTNIGHMDDSFDDTSDTSFRHQRRFCTKIQRLPPIIKANQQKREQRSYQWLTNFQQANHSSENGPEPFTSFIDETSKSSLPGISPIQKQIRSFLDTLPTYEGIQHGFDSFASSSLYTHRIPVVIR